MGLNTADLTDFRIFMFVIATVFAIGGLLVFFIVPLLRKVGRLTPEERRAIWAFIIIIFIFLASIVAAFGYDWYIELSTREKSYEEIIKKLRTNRQSQQSLEDLKLLLRRLDKRLSMVESRILNTIHKRESLKLFADDLEAMDKTNLLSVLESEIFSRIIRKYESFLSLDSDRARVIYETRSILGYAETITIASISIFLPLLILIWNNAQQRVSNTLEKLISLRDDNNTVKVNQNDLEQCIKQVHEALKELKQIGREFTPPFWITILFTVIFFVSLAYTNFTMLGDLDTYLVIVIHKACAIVLFLWLLALLSIYQLAVQPIVRGYSHLHLFNLEDI